MKARFGLTLSNRGIITGATTVDEMLRLAEHADNDPRWHSVWVGDSRGPDVCQGARS
jgi:hypothetical protein